MKFSIYGIVDPRSDQIFYIGHSSRFALRSRQHLAGEDSLSGLTIKQIKTSGLVPAFVVFERCESKEAALMAEIFWIELLRGRGTPLTNAQAFAGYVARGEARLELADGLGGLAGVKYDPDRLESVANGRPSRRGYSWTRKEDDLLTKLMGEGRSLAEIADRLGRTMGGVEARIAGRSPGKASGRHHPRCKPSKITMH